MNKFDAYIKNFQKTTTTTPSKDNKSLSKDILKSKLKTSEKPSVDPIKKKVSNETNSKNKKKDDSQLLKANYNLIIEERKNPKIASEGPMTRSASNKKNHEESEEKDKTKLKVEPKSNFKTNRSQTVDNPRLTTNSKNFKSNFLPKSSFILKKRLQFKDDTQKVKNKSSAPVKVDKSEEVKLIGKKTHRSQIENNISKDGKSVQSKKKYSSVGSKVKEFLKKSNEALEQKENKKGTESVSKSAKKKTTDKSKEVKRDNSKVTHNLPRSKSNKFFGTKINLKQGYQEKVLNRPKTFRKMKQNKEKQFEKLKNRMKNQADLKYLGKGKDGLDNEEELIEDVNLSYLDNNKDKEEVFIENSQTKVVFQKSPFFSEGYYTNLEEVLKSAQKGNEPYIINPVEKEKTDEKLATKDLSNIKLPRPNPTPNRLLTNKLTTAIKSSFKKRVPLDSEIRMLSQEFRCLLSGKKREVEEPVEKKLNFNDEPKQEEANHNKIEEVPEQDENSYTADNLNQNEVEQLENDILLKVLEENFGFIDFRPGQLQIIKNILNNKTTLAILPPGGGKSLCFQLPSLVLEGLTIVISPLLALITDQINSLPPCLSGACLSSFTNPKQRSEIIDAIKSNKIKILFITPERFALENFSEIEDISLICFDEASCASPLVPNFRSSYITIQNIIKKLKPHVMLFLANNITEILEENLVQLYKIEEVVKQRITLPKNVKLLVSKDENKLQSLVKLLRSQNYKNVGSTIIFCNLKKTVDKVTSFLNQNGMSAGSYHSGKSEFERQMTQANFMNDKIKIIVCTMAFSMGISKKDVRLVILFDLPPSIEHLLQQIGRGGRDGKEFYVHVFLNDEDYFTQRNMLYMENIDKAQTMKYIEYLFNLVNPNPKSNKRNYLEAFENKSPLKNNLYVTDVSLPRTVSFNFTHANEYSAIKKQTQLYLLLSLINSTAFNLTELDDQKNEESECYSKIPHSSTAKLTCLGIGPTVINIRFYKSSPEKLAEAEPNIKLILESSKDFQGVKRFNTIEVCEKIGITYIDLINYLYHLQSRGELSYESKEEGVFLNVEKIPESFKDIMHFLYDKIQYLINLNMKKLNAAYVLLRKFAVNNFENIPFFKQEKQGPIKCLTNYQDFSSYENEFKIYFEKYFETHDGKNFN